MLHKTAIDLLLTERQRVIAEKSVAMQKFREKIAEIECAIEELSGEKSWEVANEVIFDDEHPDYIKQSAEEI